MNIIDNIEADEHSLAYELLVEVKHSAKRWFVAFCFMLVLEILTIAGFLWYISLPAEELTQTEQTMEEIQMTENNDISQSIGE